MNRRAGLCGLVLIASCALSVTALLVIKKFRDPLGRALFDWRLGGDDARERLATSGQVACPGASFILPADGFIGLLYGDPRGPYSKSRPHQGIDIFSNSEPGLTPIYAAFDGYISREADWLSTLIQRVPEDPLEPERQIWLYYTHMADKTGEVDFIDDAFPQGTREAFVEQGTLLGYTGNYSGNPLRPVWVHLHFSIVLDDGRGGYRNELEFRNTVDPSPYLGLAVNYACQVESPACTSKPTCSQISALGVN